MANGFPSPAPEIAVDVVDHEATGPVVRHLEPGEEAQWDQFVLSSPYGTFFHLSGWMRIVESVLGHRCLPLVAVTAGKISGVFPIAQVRNIAFGNALISLPLAVYGGICANDSDSYLKLLQAGSELAHRLDAKYLEMRNRFEPFPTSLPGKNLYLTFTQNLSQGPERLFQSLPRDTRYAIRKSQKAGLEWTDDLSESEFYEIYARSVHRLGTPVFPSSLFRCLREAFPQKVRVFGVRKSGKAIAAVMTFYFRDTVLPYYGGSLQGYARESPNNFMYWNLIAQSSRAGLREFDFGRSKRGTGSCQFKSAWSMVETDLPYRYCLVKAKQVPQLSPIDATFQLPVAVWKRLPFGLTKVLGPRVIRWIPSV
jgi:FemAB-related protein (PEP-CTERM system-associated)